MKHSISALTLALVVLGAGAVLLLTQPAQSAPTIQKQFPSIGLRVVGKNPPPAPSSPTNAHITELDVTLGAGQTTNSFALPLLDRTIRLSCTFKGTDGEIIFGEVTCLSKSATNEFLIQSGDVFSAGTYHLPLVKADGNQPGLIIGPGTTRGTVKLEKLHPAAGKLHVTFWH